MPIHVRAIKRTFGQVDVIFPTRGKANGSLLVVFCTKRETYFLGLGDSGRGKLQCVPFITLKRMPN